MRGVRLFVDGIPATMPDGQGQASTFDLANASRVEVLRGPFAQMYGNASGGVVQVFTPDPPKDGFTGRAATGFGSDGQWQAGVALAGGNDRLGGSLDAWTYQTDGYRDHSSTPLPAQRQDRGPADHGHQNHRPVQLLHPAAGRGPARAHARPGRRQPRQAVPAATQFNTGKDVEQTQAGVVVEHQLNERDSLNFRLYGGGRQLTQRLGFSGAAPSSAGGIVDLDRTYGGTALAWTRKTTANGLPLQWTAGIEANAMRDARHGYVNDNGQQGALRRDETDEAADYGAFAQFNWSVHPAWELVGGLRASMVRLRIDDHYVTAASPDDSGTSTYHNVSPVAGVVWHAHDTLNVYANLGRGFETPTLTEVAYGPGGVGANLGLQASTSRQGEIGVKWQAAGQEGGGRAVRRGQSRRGGAGIEQRRPHGLPERERRARRRGLELGWRGTFGQAQQWGRGWGYTYLSAYFGEAYLNAQGLQVAAGNRLPGTARHSLGAELTYRPLAPLMLGVEARADSQVYADDLNTQAAPGYMVFNLKAGYEFRLGRTRLYLFGRIDNLADRHYIGSVIVNEANGRYFEPAAGRRFFLGLRASM